MTLDPPAAPDWERRPFGHLEPFLRMVRQLGFSPRGIVDVGAHRGDWTRLARSVFPGVPALLIEPQPELAADLDRFAAEMPGVRWVQAGAGASAGRMVQTIWEDLQGSSFLPLIDEEALRTGRQREVRMVRLDDLLVEGPEPDLVKLDVQGFELEVLQGAPSIFGRTELFILETSLYDFLPGIPLVREVIAFMAERGYELYDIVGWIYRPVDGALGQLDLAFARSRGILRRHDRW